MAESMTVRPVLTVSAGRDRDLTEPRIWLSDNDGQAATVNLQCCGVDVQGDHLAPSGYGQVACPVCGLWYHVEVEVRVTTHAIPPD